MTRTLAALLALALAACGSSSAVPPAEGSDETHADPAEPAPPDPADEDSADEDSVEAEPAAPECNDISDCPPGRILPAYTQTVACVEHRCVYSGHVTDPEANAP